MSAADYLIYLTLSVFLIIGVYQFYFWCQRNYVAQPPELRLPVDDWIPYRPGWVWIYSFLYYLLLLGFQMAFFLGFPVVTPQSWREHNRGRTLSERFLAFVQSLDARSNSFPSMHTSVATLTALHLSPILGSWGLAFPLLIGLSCLFTKQHYLIDVPAGAAIGWVTFQLYRLVA